jgi:hypothetical protein
MGLGIASEGNVDQVLDLRVCAGLVRHHASRVGNPSEVPSVRGVCRCVPATRLGESRGKQGQKQSVALFGLAVAWLGERVIDTPEGSR